MTEEAYVFMRRLEYDEDTDDVVLIIDAMPKELSPVSPLSPFTPLSQTTDQGRVSHEEFYEDYYKAASSPQRNLLDRVSDAPDNAIYKDEPEQSRCSLHSIVSEPFFLSPSGGAVITCMDTEAGNHQEDLRSRKSGHELRDSDHLYPEQHLNKTRTADGAERSKSLPGESLSACEQASDFQKDEEVLDFEAIEVELVCNPQARGMMPEPGLFLRQPSTSDYVAKGRFSRIFGDTPDNPLESMTFCQLSSIDNRPSTYNPDAIVKTTSTDYQDLSCAPLSKLTKSRQGVTSVMASEEELLNSPREVKRKASRSLSKSKSFSLKLSRSLSRSRSILTRAQSSRTPRTLQNSLDAHRTRNEKKTRKNFWWSR